MSGFTLTSSHCVSGAVIHRCVLSDHRAQLQGELVLGRVSGDGGAALEGWAVVSVPIITYAPNPLQPLPWGLADPVPAVTIGDGGTIHSTGKGEGL